MSAYERALQALGFRQRSYQSVFEGSSNHLVLADLADYARAFTADPDITREDVMVMHGRRQMFFRIVNHLKLAPNELEAVYRTALLRSAARLNAHEGVQE